MTPDSLAALYAKASEFHREGSLTEALAEYDKIIEIRPGVAAVHVSRGAVLFLLKRYVEALASFDRAISIDANHADALFSRGTILQKLARAEEALSSYDRAIQSRPNFAMAYNNRGLVLCRLNRIDEAIESHERAIALMHDQDEFHLNKALCLLLMGKFREAWPLYERRRTKAKPRLPAREIPQSWADGYLEGKTMLIEAEQGLGDTIQFCRYAKHADEAGAKVTLLVQSTLTRLLTGLSPTITILESRSLIADCDIRVALLSMPLMFNTDENSIPCKIPYLQAEQDRVSLWKGKLEECAFRIGIAWQGEKGVSDVGRSFSVRNFEHISKIPGVRLLSLQRNDGAEQLRELPDGMKVETFGDDFDAGPDAFLDSAAVMENMDLIITSDTAIAHLAGALGRPVWIALQHVPEWRWLRDRSDSPWYPTMRLFRQPSRGDWSGVFAEMEVELARFLNGQSFAERSGTLMADRLLP